MLRVVVDTSSLVSYVLTRGEIMRRVMAHWQAEAFMLITSPATLGELRAVLARPAIQRLSVVPLIAYAEGIEHFSYPVPGHVAVSACRDPQDDKFLACALEGEAHYLVSSDRDLLDMRIYQHVAIVNPGQFLVALELYPLLPEVLAARFTQETLAEIHANIPLEPGTAGRLRQVLSVNTDSH
jgi:putative PIN family toxin of toxin-antitoxin system